MKGPWGISQKRSRKSAELCGEQHLFPTHAGQLLAVVPSVPLNSWFLCPTPPSFLSPDSSAGRALAPASPPSAFAIAVRL